VGADAAALTMLFRDLLAERKPQEAAGRGRLPRDDPYRERIVAKLDRPAWRPAEAGAQKPARRAQASGMGLLSLNNR
jgi:hypothetical protein